MRMASPASSVGGRSPHAYRCNDEAEMPSIAAAARYERALRSSSLLRRSGPDPSMRQVCSHLETLSSAFPAGDAPRIARRKNTGKRDVMGNGFGDRVKAARIAAGLGVRELARRAGLAPATVSRVEAGQRDETPSAATVAALADALRVDGMILLTGGQPKRLDDECEIDHVADALGYGTCAVAIAKASIELQGLRGELDEQAAAMLLAEADLLCRRARATMR